MSNIISVSYDETLLRTRHLMLEQGGHRVSSAVGYNEAIDACKGSADLLIIGHSIPKQDKVDIIVCFRGANPKGLIVALTRAGEQRIKQVDAYINPGDPEELLRAIRYILEPAKPRKKWNVRSIR